MNQKTQMTIDEAIRSIAARLEAVVDKDEARAMASVIIEDVKGYKPIDVVIYGHRQLLPETVERIDKIVSRVINGEPLQYALGSASFHGRNFAVRPGVLIPRPETSQLVDIIEKEYAGISDLRILDIGTGSGCIAISLALDLPFSEVTAIDISDQALEVAQENAKSLRAKVKFVKADALQLTWQISERPYNIIVSNPPYVLEKERESIDARVAEHEPQSALFVPDDDPLRFYKPIAEYAHRALAGGGRLYLECNPHTIDAAAKMIKNVGFYSVENVCDYKGTKRFIIAHE